MTLEIEPTIFAEIKEQAKAWLDYETERHEQVLKEKRWDVIDIQECKTVDEVCKGTIAHRIMEALYPEEYHRLMELMLDALNTVQNTPFKNGD